MSVRVFHGDDSSAFRLLVKATLASDAPDIDIVGGAGTPDGLLSGIEETQPDVVLLDQFAGPDIVDRVRALKPGVRVVVLSGYPPEGGDRELAGAADAYVVKSATLEDLPAAIRG